MRRDVRRAAWFLWIRPRDAALSMRFCARRTAAGALSSPLSIAAVATLVRVLSSERTAWLRTWRRSFDRFRLIWLLMFAMTRAITPYLTPEEPDQATAGPPPRRCWVRARSAGAPMAC